MQSLDVYADAPFNRTSVELKLSIADLQAQVAALLIEPVWN